jgi:hypothetical protein
MDEEYNRAYRRLLQPYRHLAESGADYAAFLTLWRADKAALLARMRTEPFFSIVDIERATDYATANLRAKTRITAEERETRDVVWRAHRDKLLARMRRLVTVAEVDTSTVLERWRRDRARPSAYAEDGLPARYRVDIDQLAVAWMRDPIVVALADSSLETFERLLTDPGCFASDAYEPAKRWLSRALVRALRRKRIMNAADLADNAPAGLRADRAGSASDVADNAPAGLRADDDDLSARAYYVGELRRWSDTSGRCGVNIADVERLREPDECQNVAGDDVTTDKKRTLSLDVIVFPGAAPPL